MKLTLILTAAFLFFLFIISCRREDQNEKIFIDGVRNPMKSLNGIWKFTMQPPEGFQTNAIIPESWDSIKVPGECAMQGFPVKHDIPFVYKKLIEIPADYFGKMILLFFEGIYNNAKVWINGNFAGEHRGGFTPWTCNITPFVIPGQQVWVTIEVTDFHDDVSYGSGYAKHPIGGILRNVWLKALPENCLEKLCFETKFDALYSNAVLDINFKLVQNRKIQIQFTLKGKNGRKIASRKINNVPDQAGADKVSIPVKKPLKWDAEHPNLYSLKTEIIENGKVIYRQEDNIGFREVKVTGNRLLVNGKPVKLRGANRHSIHPLLGRSDTEDNDMMDVLLAKEANINFIRTSHYPPTSAFLKYCDRYGIYVESESAVCFMSTHKTPDYASQENKENPDQQIIRQFREMVEANRNHPSCIIWSLGNESAFHPVFFKLYTYIKDEDPTRPVIFSYPGSVPDSMKCYDILSMHYPSSEGNLTQRGITIKNFKSDSIPVLYDEWAHVACYNKPTLQADPNVRDFWGQSLDKIWGNLFEEPGGLGGAIWCMIDETFMMPEKMDGFGKWWGVCFPGQIPMPFEGPSVGYGEWGIIDTWRRKKPEFWNVKKAYSPARILINEVNIQSGDLEIPVYNRFDHTNLAELKIVWKFKGISDEVNHTDIKPHGKGEILIPEQKWGKNEMLNLAFFGRDSLLIDTHTITVNPESSDIVSLQSEDALKTEEDKEGIRISGNGFSLSFDKKTALMDHAVFGDDTLIRGGPYLNLLASEKGTVYSAGSIKQYAKDWHPKQISVIEKEKSAIVKIAGVYGNIKAVFTLTINPKGTIKNEFTLKEVPELQIFEFGCTYKVASQFSALSWLRKGYWTTYSEGHPGGLTGFIAINDSIKEVYRTRPEKKWEQDIKNFYYNGIENPIYKYRLTNQARAKKENILKYSLVDPEGNRLSVKGNGEIACRIEKDDPKYMKLNISCRWDYPDLNWGNWIKNAKTTRVMSGEFLISPEN